MVASRTAWKGAGFTALATALLSTTPAFAQDASDEDVVVTAQRENQSQVSRNGSLGALGDKDAMDTPFAIKSYNSALILNQQPQTLGQVLENDPSIRVSGAFGTPAELFVVRGFNLFSDDIAFNGMYGLTPRQLVAPELYDQVQVLSGASAFLNGAAPGGSGLGGNINLISKRAGDKAITRVTANYASDAHFGGSFDVGRRFGNGDFGVRVNGAFRAGDVAVDDEFRRAAVLGGSFDWRAGDLTVTLDLAYQRLFVRGLRYKVAIGAVIPRVPRSDANYSQQWQYYEQRDLFGMIGFNYKLSDNAEIYGSFGARDGLEEGVSLNAVLLTDPALGTAVGNNAQFTPRADNNEAAQAGIRVRGNSGSISHELNLGGSLSWQVARAAYQRYAAYTTNIYDPVQVPRPPENATRGGNLADPFPVTRLRNHSLYVSDTLGFADDRALLTVGLRYQSIEDRRYAYNQTGAIPPGGQTTRYKKGATTPVVGLVVKPTDNISLYANRIEGLSPGPSAPVDAALINSGQVFDPFKTVQYEVGGKAMIGGLNASIAFFQSDRPNAYSRNISPLPTTGPTRIFVVEGIQRNRGVELAIDGEITKGLRVISGASIIDAKLRRNADPALDGNRAVGVPEYTANANVEWDVVPGITLTGRVMHTGPQMVRQDNSLELPAWTRFDAGARFVTVLGGNPVTFRANVDNVLNKRYWASAFTGFPAFDASLLQGLPRTFKASATIDF
ncbi:MAG: TonB-dependent siderophore receptor [Alphaproteobacteria bacterium HGW-Alphaproteobacteria-16]|nr:MAG: TonB-dependent siderophore receptor [Alphaproteobacteria bacterium HGW-Alphaproteobacteria-16]